MLHLQGLLQFLERPPCRLHGLCQPRLGPRPRFLLLLLVRPPAGRAVLHMLLHLRQSPARLLLKEGPQFRGSLLNGWEVPSLALGEVGQARGEVVELGLLGCYCSVDGGLQGA